ncbi:MAG TPA: tetratricopeptide repeat protein [Terriglobales bacterium]|nr:tetratricopeptide repeat protein [Terriglobales bacterium]
MALGFGFNKAKVLAAAERFVQQGKLQNAIAEYLKVIREDPKDLTVMNTVGDLHARVGQTTEAIQYFKQVGEAYAGDGFMVKAIAIYKKLTKLSPGATDCLLKLAELYSQQGLYNDARAQYLSVADRFLRSGDNQQASSIFQKLLELDPENAAMQAKLADLYVKLGNKEDARNIFFSAAESLFRRGALEAADEALERVLTLDPAHTPAVMLRGRIAAETGKAEKAIQYLEKVPDLDSQPDGLRALLRVQLQTGNDSEALPIASKLVGVHNDASGIILCADHLMAAGQHEAALRLYDQYAERLLADDRDSVMARVASAPAHLNNNPAALELVLKLYRKAGESSHVNEVMELLAHSLVQAGELVRARDLYNQLAALEPENPVHAQNYKQVSAKLGDDAATRPLTPDEGAQALMVDELEIDAPAVDQEYAPELARAIRTALTDSELLDSYNLPAKAIAPLEAVLPSAPRDVLLNQRLASLYVRAERHSDAARCCDVLHAVYRKAGHNELAAQYSEMSAKYHQRAGESGPDYANLPEPVPAEVESSLGPGPPPPVLEAAAQTPPLMTQSAEPAVAPERRSEGDASRQWEAMTAVEPPDGPASTPLIGKQAPGDVVGDLLEEIKFYVSQEMWEEAQAALAKCAALAPGIPELDEFREQVEKSRGAAASTPDIEVMEEGPALEPTVATLVFDDADVDIADSPSPPPSQPQVSQPRSEPVHEDVAIPAPLPPLPAVSEPVAVAEARTTPQAGDALTELVHDLEESLGQDFGAIAASAPASTPPTSSAPPLAAAAPPQRPVEVTPRPVPREPVAVPVVPAAVATIVTPQMPQALPPDHEPGSTLSDIFEDFKEDMEGDGSTAEEEDPETHYNLGVAFKEMGLLEEAIGELQKVCHAIDRGQTFPHSLQVYTWLAQCLVQKGAPQAAIKWYQRAAQLPTVDEETRMAVHYEIAAAYEAAGNRQAALDNFMEVYANNIDYRDVAERIKTLKA